MKPEIAIAHRLKRALVATIFAVMSLIAAPLVIEIADAQTPLPKTTPKLPNILWLDSLNVDMTPITEGASKAITATVTLMRPADQQVKVELELLGATPVRGNPGMQSVDCVRTFRFVHVESNSTYKKFPIYTGSRQPRVGTPPTTVPKTFTITARYGSSQRVSATFTVNCPQ